jgi:hypothetical protein
MLTDAQFSRLTQALTILQHAEAGLAREVISRLLEDFAARGLVRSSRGEVEVLDAQGLE